MFKDEPVYNLLNLPVINCKYKWVPENVSLIVNWQIQDKEERKTQAVYQSQMRFIQLYKNNI